jgi:D-sedoheptulose 7-phosphate isomerase
MTVEPTAFLYPFIDAEERGTAPLLLDLAVSAREKIDESATLQRDTLERCADELTATADAMVRRFGLGATLFAFGNGGSATDAEAAVHGFGRLGLAARNLAADPAVLTALSNDVGFELVFARQLIAHAGSDDIALAFSTSGGSPNVVAGLIEARRLGLLTVAILGYDGGTVAARGLADHCLVVRSDSVHRVQESQDALRRALADLIAQGLRVPS